MICLSRPGWAQKPREGPALGALTPAGHSGEARPSPLGGREASWNLPAQPGPRAHLLPLLRHNPPCGRRGHSASLLLARGPAVGPCPVAGTQFLVCPVLLNPSWGSASRGPAHAVHLLSCSPRAPGLSVSPTCAALGRKGWRHMGLVWLVFSPKRCLPATLELGCSFLTLPRLHTAAVSKVFA